MKVAVRYGDMVAAAARQAGKRPRRLRRAAQGAGARAGRVGRSALHQGRRRRALRAGHSAAPQGPLHRRVRSREPGARRLHQESRRDPDAARQPGGRRDRERPAVRGRSAPTRSGWRRKSGSRSASRRRCCRRSCRSASRAWTSPPGSRRRASSAAISTTFVTPEPNSLVVAVGDVSGKGVPAALYSAFAGELVRSRTSGGAMRRSGSARPASWRR